LGACCEGSRRSHHRQVGQAVDRNRFRCRAGLEKEKCPRNGLEKRAFLALRFCRGRQEEIYSRLAAFGAVALISNPPPTWALASGWKEIGGTPIYFHYLGKLRTPELESTARE
jgi:hypothetical protein